MLNNRETDRKKSAQYMYDTQKTFLKNLTNFSSTHVRSWVKDATPPLRFNPIGCKLSLHITNNVFLVIFLIV